MKKLLLFTIFFVSQSNFSQVGVGTTTPDATAVLDVVSSDKGVLVPRVSLVDISNTTSPINAPATGLMVWNTNAATVGGSGVGFYFFNGTIWYSINSNTNNNLDQAYDEGGAGAGRVIIADAKPVRIDGTDGLWVTGTHGSGALLEASPYTTQMFFYPRKSAFRAGYDSLNYWVDANVGEYSAAFGRNTRATGLSSFAANEDTEASGTYAAAFGKFTLASGEASIALGNTNQSTGRNSFTAGSNSLASGDNSAAIGRQLFARSFSEIAFGSFNTDYVPNSLTAFNASDRIFSIGYGDGAVNRKDAIEVFKDGRVKFNNRYTFPLLDGAANQVMVTDGLGNLSWQDQKNTKNITNIPLYAADVTQITSGGGFTLIPGCRSAVIPSTYNSGGNVQVKLMIRYTAVSGTVSDNEFRVVADSGSSTNIVTESDTWTNTTTTTGGVYESEWKNWNGGVNTYELFVNSRNTGGGSMTIANIYLMVRTQ
ncbi:hypothetical protein GFJ94_11385 [Flavobacterium sp. LMO8]|uniref:hypothetical protein n=1 Tax=Flavobacterium sp. LMO8 TaxID=2654244 RepID=UPI001291EA16|nr:hypothetical protein [Flavobacterium sp. LMO8]MQP25665.1 hypothetical protein [Flavobacterium sp. LMO8]